MNIFNIFRRVKESKANLPEIKDFPVLIEDYWAAGYCKENLFPYFDKDGKYINVSIGEYVPLFKCHNHIAIYKIISGYRRGLDRAMYDDGYHYNLEFIELVRSGRLEDRLKELN